MRESYSDPRGLRLDGRRSVSRSEQQQYILSEEDVRGLDSGKQFVFVNNCKPILADKLRYWEEPVLAAHCGAFFHGEKARYQQKAGRFDVPGKPQIDWLGVRAQEPASLLSETRQSARRQADRSTRAAAEASASAPAAGVRPAAMEAGPAHVSDSALSDAVHGPDFDF
jgi:type IV secretion system protein VirD4